MRFLTLIWRELHQNTTMDKLMDIISSNNIEVGKKTFTHNLCIFILRIIIYIHGSLRRQQMQLYEREIMCIHNTMKTMFGESRYVIFFYFNQYQKNNEKRKILPLSFLRDWRGQGIWPLPRVVIRACSKCSTKLMTSIRSKLLTMANFISGMLMILSIAMSSTMPSMPGARTSIRRTTVFLMHY